MFVKNGSYVCAWLLAINMVELNAADRDRKVRFSGIASEVTKALGGLFTQNNTSLIALIVDYLAWQRWVEAQRISRKAIHGITWLETSNDIASIDFTGAMKAYSASPEYAFLSNKRDTVEFSEHARTSHRWSESENASIYNIFYSRLGLLVSVDDNGMIRKWPTTSKLEEDWRNASYVPNRAAAIFNYTRQGDVVYVAAWSPVGPPPFYMFRKPGKITVFRIDLNSQEEEIQELGSIGMYDLPSCICYSPDHVTLALTHDKVVPVVNMKTWKIVHQLRHTEKIKTLAYACDRAEIISASDAHIWVWNYERGYLLFQVPCFISGVKSIMYDTPQLLVALGSRKGDTLLAEWDMAQKKVVREALLVGAEYSGMSYAPDKSKLALYGYAGLQIMNNVSPR